VKGSIIASNTADHNNAVLNWIRIKVTNKLIVKLMLMMFMSILKIVKNLLRKITSAGSLNVYWIIVFKV